MTTSVRTRWFALALLLAIPAVMAADRTVARKSTSPAKETVPAKEVEMFAAMEAGDIEVQFIPKNVEEARVFVKNKTNQPLKIEMPAAFAAMPVLAQFGGGGGGMGGGGMGGGGGGGGNQGMGGGMGGGGMGGGMGGGGMGGGGMGGGGGFFNVAPEKVGQIKVGTLCLEHGKKDPRPGVKYEIKPIEALTKNPAVHELLRNFANDRYPQRSAQAAAWHLNNNMTWQQLAAKVIDRLGRPDEPYYNAQELNVAIAISEEVKAQAEKAGKTVKPQSNSASTSASASVK